MMERVFIALTGLTLLVLLAGVAYNTFAALTPYLELHAFLTWWSWRPEVIFILVTIGSAFAAGWWRLRHRSPRAAPGWQLAVYLAGLVAVVLALLSPLDRLASQLFLLHMLQHALLIMIAAPLLLLANPLPAVVWALPTGPRRGVRHLLGRGGPVRWGVQTLTRMPLAWPLYVVTLWAWHYPAAYQAALRHDFMHDLEHLAFFGSALLFWWPLINPAPRLHGHLAYGARIVYVSAAAGQNTLLAALLALPGQVLYPYYTAVPRLWGLTALEDQVWAGAIMGLPGGMMYLLTAMVLVARLSGAEERGAPQRQAVGLQYVGRYNGGHHGPTV